MLLLNGNLVCPSTFPDGTLSLRTDTDDYYALITWKYESDAEMPVLYYLTKHLDAKGVSINLDLPYIPNARMDRVKNDDEIFTLKYFAEFINSLGFRAVFVRDPHSSVSCALINNLVIESAEKYICNAISNIHDENLVLYYPDEGAMKRYSSLIPNRPYAFGIKDRDWRSGEIRDIIMMNEDLVRGKNILIVDDICSRGWTFYHSALALKSAGANDIFLYVTHCENTITKGDLIKSDLIKHIYTTDSIFTLENEKITVL